MSNVVRLVNGGSIQVRTGVLQGIGPQGPRGLRGPQGNDGAQGPVGETGPMGAIAETGTRTTVGVTTSVPANTDTLVAFGAGDYDQLSAIKSNTNIGFNDAGHYMLSAWVRFNDAATGYRDLWFVAVTGTATIARTTVNSVAGNPCYVNLNHAYRSVSGGGELVQVYARSSAATSISLGGWTVTRCGAGPEGPAGPIGPAGPQGLTGAQGNTGPAGSASSGFATYALLKTP